MKAKLIAAALAIKTTHTEDTPPDVGVFRKFISTMSLMNDGSRMVLTVEKGHTRKEAAK